MDHGPPSQNAPDAKKAKKTFQTTLKFTGGKVTTGETGTGAEGIAYGAFVEVRVLANNQIATASDC